MEITQLAVGGADVQQLVHLMWWRAVTAVDMSLQPQRWQALGRGMLQYGPISFATVFLTWRLSVRAYVNGFIHTRFSLGHHPPVSGQHLCARHGSGMCYYLFWDVPSGLSHASAP